MQTHVLATANAQRLGLSSRALLHAQKFNITRARNITNGGCKAPDLPGGTKVTRNGPESGLRSTSHDAGRPIPGIQRTTCRHNLSGTARQGNGTSIRSMSTRSTVVTERHFLHQLMDKTKDPLWKLLLVLNNPGTRQDTLHLALLNAHIPDSQYHKWTDVINAQDIDEALKLSAKVLKKPSSSRSSSIPYWIVLHIVASKVRTPAQAHGPLLDLLDSHLKTVSEETHAPYLILAAYHLSRFTLSIPLRAIIERFLNTPVALASPEDIPTDPTSPNPNPTPPPPPAVSYNLFLQALSTNPVRSVESANNVVALLKSMDSRQLRLMSSTYLHLLSDRFVTLQLTKYLQQRMIQERVVPTVEHLEAYLRVFAREGAIHDAKQYLDIIHAVTGSQKGTTNEREYDPRFAANTLFLNAQDSRTSAFGFLKSLVEETPIALPPTKQPSSTIPPDEAERQISSDASDPDTRLQNLVISESDLSDLDSGFSSSPPQVPPQQSVKLSYKPYRDIYDLTAALHVAAKDLSTPTRQLIHLFMDIQHRSRTSSSEDDIAAGPTVATYTVLIRGLLLRRQYAKAVQFWERFLKTGMEVDEQILAAGVIALTRDGKPHQAFQTLEKFCGTRKDTSSPKRVVTQKNETSQQNVESLLAPSSNDKSTSVPDAPRKSDKPVKPPQPPIQPSIHLINAYLVALLRISRPDVVFRLWTHMEALYGVVPNAQSLSVLLQAGRRGEGLDWHGVGGDEEGWKGIKAKLFGIDTATAKSGGGLNPFGSEAWRWIGGPFVSALGPRGHQPGSSSSGKTKNLGMGTKRREIAVDDILTVLGHPSKGNLRRYTHSLYHHQFSLPSPWQAHKNLKNSSTTPPTPLPLITPLAFARKIFHQALFANDYGHILPTTSAPASYLRATYDADGTSAGSTSSSPSSSSSSSTPSVLSQALSSLLPLPTPSRPKRWDPEESMTRDMWNDQGEAWFPSLVLTNANFFNYIALVGLCGRGDAGVAVRRSRGRGPQGYENKEHDDGDMNTVDPDSSSGASASTTTNYITSHFPEKNVDWSIGGPGEIPLVLARMRALGIQPSEATLALSLVLWGEVSVGAPLVERFGSGRRTSPPSPALSPRKSSSMDTKNPPSSDTDNSPPPPSPALYGEDGGAEYRRLVDWLRDWVGESRLPHWRTLQKWQRVVAEMRANLEFGAWTRVDGASGRESGGRSGGKDKDSKPGRKGIFGSAFWEGEVGSGKSTAIQTKVVGYRPPKC